MLMDAARSCLLVIDIQERLVAAMDGHRELIDHARWLIEVAGELDVPVVASRQYPKGLGPLVPEIDELVPSSAQVDKLEFSCAASPECREALAGTRRGQIIVTGIETHVCVLQTAIGLRHAGHEVFVVADAVSSRRPADRELALTRMRDHGVEVVNREMVAFEWLGRAGTERFRTVSKQYIR